jgi:hypothetical protein
LRIFFNLQYFKLATATKLRKKGMCKGDELVSVGVQNDSISKKEGNNCYSRLITEGHLTDGDHGISPKDISFDWVDPDLVKKGQLYFRYLRHLSKCSDPISLLVKI